MLRSLVAPETIPANGEFTLRRNLSTEQLEAALENGERVWIDVVDATEDEITWLEEQLNLHPAVVSDLQRADRHPTLMVYPDYLFLSLFQPRTHLKKVYGEEIHCIIADNVFLTIRNSRCDAVDTAYERMTRNIESWRRGVVYCLYLTIQFVVDSYYPLLDNISNQLNDLEEALLTRNSRTKLTTQTIYHLKHNLIQLRQMVAPQREVLSSVIGEERLANSSNSRDLFHHLYERLLRVYDVIDSQRDLSSNVLDLLQSRESDYLATAVSRLTIVSMIFLPLTLLIGLFELNFYHMESELTIPLRG